MRLGTTLVGVALAAVWLAPSTSRAQEGDCASDADCPEGYICLQTPCACDPDDEECPIDECGAVCVEDWGGPIDCETDADCEDGWVCAQVGASGCGGVACPDGEDCPEPPPCEPEEIWACVPPPPDPCESDADCEEGLICVTYDVSVCSGGGAVDCPPGSECPEPDPPECEDATESYCVPPYFAPCSEDADCGEGFSCVEGETCGCSAGGAGGTSSGDGASTDGSSGSGSSGTDEVPDCGCEPSGELYCQLDEMPCESDADCPDDFVCEAIPTTVPCRVDEATGETVCETTDPPEADGYCLPGDWDRWLGGTETASGGASDGNTSREAYDDAVEDSIGAGEAQASGRAADFENPLDDGDSGVQPAGGGSSSDSGGCQVGPDGVGQAPGLLLALLGLVGLAIGRRRPRRRTR